MAQPTKVTRKTLQGLAENLDHTIEDLEDRIGDAEGAKAEALEARLAIFEDFRQALEEAIGELESLA